MGVLGYNRKAKKKIDQKIDSKTKTNNNIPKI